MNEDARFETQKRIHILNKVLKSLPQETLGAILVGSMAYAPGTDIHPDSDIDLVIVYQDAKACIPFSFSKEEALVLNNLSFDGYLVKQTFPFTMSGITQDIKVSLHNLSLEAFNKISQGLPQTLTYYRASKKNKIYSSLDFDGIPHFFTPTRTDLPNLSGEQRIDPIAFLSETGNYVMGNDIDKLLSAAQIKLDKTGDLSRGLEKLWYQTARRLYAHRLKHHQSCDNLDLAPYLCRFERFSKQVRQNIKTKTSSILFSVPPSQKATQVPESLSLSSTKSL